MPKPTLFKMLESILAHEGVLGLYSGLSAAVLRQCTYTTVRFGAYDMLKENVIPARSGDQYGVSAALLHVQWCHWWAFGELCRCREHQDAK